LGPRDRIVVVADNCSDDTAELARDAGAEVVERHNADFRGKGYALACGVDYLRGDNPDVVLVVDADCVISDGALAAIAVESHNTGHPVQMLDLMHTVPGSGLKLRVMEFAMVMKNHVRPRGSFRLGRACHLMGTGMAIPWALISTAQLATGHVTEDMKLGVEMAKAGRAPYFMETVRVTSAFVADSGVAKVQKSRWEHGHLATIAEELPGLLRASARQKDPALIVMAMDLLIPPVALYFLVLAGLTPCMIALAWFWPTATVAASAVALAAGCFGLSIGLAWFFFGRQILSAKELFTAPLYAIWKAPVYLAYFMKKRSGWVRTRRDKE
jgi:glycosyltransferase involved in cell wall biosynthesis